MRFGAMMAGGVLGLVAVKLMAAFLFPLVGVGAAVLMLGLKALFWLAIAYTIYRVFFRRRRDRAEI